jgi:Bacterial SH3 domain
MTRVLLFLSVVGAVIYALLLVTHDELPGGKAEDTFAGQTQPDHPVVQRLSSWDAYLPSRSQAPLATSQQPALLPSQQRESPSQNSERKHGTEYPLAASEDKPTTSESGGAAPEPVEWAKVVLAAETHSQASVSSAVVRFYRPGTELQVVGRGDGWFQVSDPVTQERGWIFEKYLSSIDGPSPTQVATESTTEPLVTKPALPKSKNRSRSAKPAVRIFHGVAVANSDPWSGRWARRADRRRGFGLFMFRPFGGRFAGHD